MMEELLRLKQRPELLKSKLDSMLKPRRWKDKDRRLKPNKRKRGATRRRRDVNSNRKSKRDSAWSKNVWNKTA